MNKLKAIMLAVALLFCSMDGQAQFKSGLTEVSVLFSNTQMGVPFVKMFPIRPGIELSATFLTKMKPQSTQRISGHAGYIHHNVLVYAPYLKITYDYEYKLKNVIGLNVYAGIGYLHAFYPGEGYRFNEASKTFESTKINQAFFLSNIGIGMTYLKSSKINPFIKYNLNYLGFSLDYRYLISGLHVGVNINLNNENK